MVSDTPVVGRHRGEPGDVHLTMLGARGKVSHRMQRRSGQLDAMFLVKLIENEGKVANALRREQARTQTA